MADNNNDNSKVLEAIAGLTKITEQSHAALTTRINDIKDDIRRMETSQNERLNRVEDKLSGQIKSLEGNMKEGLKNADVRITALEEEDKRLIEKVAKVSFAGGGVGGALAMGLAEILKRLS